MAASGITKVWRHSYGLVETADGTVVRIDAATIEGGSLRVGRKVSFDIVSEEGQKPKGNNVTGEAVLAKDAKLTEEEVEEDKKLAAELRAKEDAKVDAVMVEINKLSRTNRKLLAQALLEKFPVVNKEEKRLDGKEAFTKGEFIAFYGAKDGEKKWQNAKVSQGGKSKKSRSRRNKGKGEKKGEDAAEGEEGKKEEAAPVEEKKEEKKEE